MPLVWIGMAGFPAQAAQWGPGNITSEILVGTGTDNVIRGNTDITPAQHAQTGAVQVIGGAMLTIENTGGPVTINARDQAGFLVTGAGSVATATGAIINSFAEGTQVDTSAVSAGDGGRITLTGGAVTYTKSNANGGQSSAIVAAGAGSSVIANGVDIATFNNADNVSSIRYFTFGVSTSNGGSVTVNGGSIVADSRGSSGNARAYGVNAAQGTVELNNVEVNTYGTVSHGVVASGGTVIVNGGSVTVHGAATALYSSGNGGDNYISATGTVISSQGGGIALDVGSDGRNNAAAIDLRNGQVTAVLSGLSADGSGLASGSRVINVVDSVITVTGSGPAVFGAIANSGGSVHLTGSSLSATSGGNGVHVGNGGVFTATGTDIAASGVGFLINGGGANSVTMTGGSLSAGAEAFKIDSGSGTSIELNGVRITNGSVFLAAAGGGTVTLAMTDMTVTGDVVTSDGSNVDMHLVNSSVLGQLPSGSSVDIDAHANWTTTGSAMLASLSNRGTVGFVSRAMPGNTLTIQRDFTSQGGTLVLNAALGGDGAVTDKVVVGGNTSGTGYVQVNNVDGGGGLTTEGIKIIDVDGTSGAHFTLAGRVAAGAYDYVLARGTSNGNAGDWYLRSNVFDPRYGWVPNVRSEVAVNSVIAPLAVEYGYAMLGTLDERAGMAVSQPVKPVYEERIVRCKASKAKTRCVARAAVEPAGLGRPTVFAGAWGRIIGDRGLRDSNNFFTSGADYDYTSAGIQAGLDIWANRAADGALDKAGLYAGYGQISSNVRGAFGGRAGSVDMDAYSLGAYWTHHAASNWYTDAVVQGTWYTTDARSFSGLRIKPDGFGIAGSLEGGYSFDLGNGMTLEPQGQVAYQNISFDDASDLYGQFRFDDGDSLRARLGLRLAKSWNMGDARHLRLVSAWGKVNVWHEFMGDAALSVAGVNGLGAARFSSPLTGTWGEISAGVSGQITDAVSAFGSASYQHSIDDKDLESWNGRIGVTVKW